MYVLWICPSSVSEPYPMTNCKRKKMIQKNITFNSHPPYNMEFSCKAFLIIHQRGGGRGRQKTNYLRQHPGWKTYVTGFKWHSPHQYQWVHQNVFQTIICHLWWGLQAPWVTDSMSVLRALIVLDNGKGFYDHILQFFKCCYLKFVWWRCC